MRSPLAVEHALEHPVDLRVHGHAAVARVDLDRLRVGVHASAPVDDAVAARVHGDGVDAGGRAARAGPRGRPAQQSPSWQLLENTPGSPRSPSQRHPAHGAQHLRGHRERVANGRAEHDQPAHAVGVAHGERARERAAAALADHDHRLAALVRRAARAAAPGARRSARRSRRWRACRSSHTRCPRRRSQWRSTPSDASPAMKPGDQQHGRCVLAPRAGCAARRRRAGVRARRCSAALPRRAPRMLARRLPRQPFVTSVT